MFYRNRRAYRGRWGMYRFVWPLFFILIFTHSWFGFLIAIGLAVAIFAIVRTIFAASPGMGSMNASPMANQPHQQAYQPYQQPYQSYDQGYQPAPWTYQEGEQQYQYPQDEQTRYEEQPKAQYPEELPPMQH